MSIQQSRLAGFTKPVDRLRIYTTVASFAAVGLEVEKGLETLVSVYERREGSEFMLKTLGAIRGNLSKGLGSALLAAFGHTATYPEEQALLMVMDGAPEKAAAICRDIIQFINLEERIANSAAKHR